MTGDKHLEILLKIQGDLSTNTEATKGVQSSIVSIKEDILDLNKKVAYTNGKVKLHTKILLVIGTAIATYLVMNGDEKFIKIVDLFL